MHHPTDRIAHTTAFVTSVVEYWLEGEIAQWVHHEDRSDDPSLHERPLLPRSYISLLCHLKHHCDGILYLTEGAQAVWKHHLHLNARTENTNTFADPTCNPYNETNDCFSRWSKQIVYWYPTYEVEVSEPAVQEDHLQHGVYRNVVESWEEYRF